MTENALDQWTITKITEIGQIEVWIDAFIIDRKAQGMKQGTIYFYEQKLALFKKFCIKNNFSYIAQINSFDIRNYLFELEETGHNAGGIHACYRALKTFLRWYEDETEPENWNNPITKVKAPKINIEPIQPVEIKDIKKMLSKCTAGTFTGERDQAILLSLLDTGARATEFINIDLEDINIATGEIVIKQGKGGKPRRVYLGKKSRRAVRSYLKYRNDNSFALWVTRDGERLTYSGLRQIVRRKAEKAKIKTPGLHDFRRAFALNFLRNNPGEIYSLQRLMGHADIQVLRRYLAQTDQDISNAHRRGSPVDNFL